MRLTPGQHKLLKQVAGGEALTLGSEITRRIAEQLEFQKLLTASGGNIIKGVNISLTITEQGRTVLKKLA